MVRPGWAEAAVDLARIAGLEPVMTFCHVLSDDGESADLETVNRLADAHKIPVVDMADIVTHRMETETFVTQTTQANLDTAHGSFMSRVFQHRLTREEHLALTLGDVRSPEPVLVRVHSECLTGDVLGSQRCDCGLQLDEAMALISKEGRGALLYLRQEGRGIGLVNKVEAYALQDAGRDTVEANIELGFEADQRDFRLGGQMLLALGIQQVKLMTNNPRKITALESAGIDVVGRLPLEFEPNESSRAYLKAKKDKLGHLLTKV
jgi:3,4-dihydroxy 2-butanone 4-phosphate synthase/GTP cyclohydrolase II